MVSLVLNFKILLTNGEYFLCIFSVAEWQRDTLGSALLSLSIRHLAIRVTAPGQGKCKGTAISIILFGC